MLLECSTRWVRRSRGSQPAAASLILTPALGTPTGAPHSLTMNTTDRQSKCQRRMTMRFLADSDDDREKGFDRNTDAQRGDARVQGLLQEAPAGVA